MAEIKIADIEGIIAKGVRRGIGQFIAVVFILTIVFALGAKLLGYSERDDTDPVDGRSGLMLRADAKTGCLYLSDRDGGLTPRLDADGKPMCGARR